MRACEKNWVRLPLSGANNVRELGGYPVGGGGQTAYHRFLRSDGLSMLTNKDVEFLRGYGLSTVIDLRDMHEVKRAPNVDLGHGVVTHHIPLLGVNLADSEEIKRHLGGEELDMRGLYFLMLENRDGVRASFEAIAGAAEGCVLFHCAVGKDRTGMLALLLLSLAGVDRFDIISNYMQSRIHLMRDEAYAADWADPNKVMFHSALDSPPEMAEYVLDLIESEHGGIVRYLMACGVGDATIDAVYARLVGETS